MTEINHALREHVTSIGFSLAISKRMIDILVALDHFEGKFTDLIAWERAGDTATTSYRRRLFAHYVTSFRSLEARGLVEARPAYKDDGRYHDPENSRHVLTGAGQHVLALLAEAGIVEERMKEIGLQ